MARGNNQMDGFLDLLKVGMNETMKATARVAEMAQIYSLKCQISQCKKQMGVEIYGPLMNTDSAQVTRVLAKWAMKVKQLEAELKHRQESLLKNDELRAADSTHEPEIELEQYKQED